MARGTVQVRVVQGTDFVRAANALRAIDNTLPTKFRTRLRKVAQPFVQKVKDEVRAIPVTGAEHSGLRRRVARGVKVRVGVGRGTFRYRIITSMVDPSEAGIPRGLDDRRGWRHPVFGGPEWVTQHTGGSWFIEPLQDIKEPLEHGLTEVLEDARDFVAGTS
jgi:hypothetical protein